MDEEHSICFPAIIFDEKLFEPELLARVTAACLLLILMSGSMYIVNDLADLGKRQAAPHQALSPDSLRRPASLHRKTGGDIDACVGCGSCLLS